MARQARLRAVTWTLLAASALLGSLLAVGCSADKAEAGASAKASSGERTRLWSGSVQPGPVATRTWQATDVGFAARTSNLTFAATPEGLLLGAPRTDTGEVRARLTLDSIARGTAVAVLPIAQPMQEGRRIVFERGLAQERIRPYRL